MTLWNFSCLYRRQLLVVERTRQGACLLFNFLRNSSTYIKNVWPINFVFPSSVQCHAECFSVHKIVCKLYLRCMQKCLLVASCAQDTCGAIKMSDLNRNWSGWTDFDGTCRENLSSGSWVVLCHQTGRQTCAWTAVSVDSLQGCDWAHKIVVSDHSAVFCPRFQLSNQLGNLQEISYENSATR